MKADKTHRDVMERFDWYIRTKHGNEYEVVSWNFKNSDYPFLYISNHRETWCLCWNRFDNWVFECASLTYSVAIDKPFCQITEADFFDLIDEEKGGSFTTLLQTIETCRKMYDKIKEQEKIRSE